jgi:hypothetical protein
MRLPWGRRRRVTVTVYFETEAGEPLPAYGVRAGMLIAATDYWHGRALRVILRPSDESGTQE